MLSRLTLIMVIATCLALPAKAQVMEYAPEKDTRMEEVVAALLLVNAYRFDDIAPGRLPVLRELARLIPIKNYQCERDLHEYVNREVDLDGLGPSHIPINRLHDTYPMLMKVKAVNLKYKPAIAEMTEVLKLRLNRPFDTAEDPELCYGIFGPYTPIESRNDLHDFCGEMQELKACTIAFLRLNRINESPIFEHLD